MLRKANFLNGLKIVAGCTGLACLVGISLACITWWVAFDFFPDHYFFSVADSEPWQVALAWGVSSSWWFGLVVGLALVVHCDGQIRAKRVLTEVALACVALVVVLVCLLLAAYGWISVFSIEDGELLSEAEQRYRAISFMHEGEYFLGGLALVVVMWRLRRRQDSAA